MKYRVVSLFSGCGGLDLGFQHYGTQLVYACDNDPAAIKAFNWNFGHEARLCDVQDEAFLQDINSIGEADIVLGGFPCQGFSKSGPKVENDPRNSLYISMVKAVKILRPKVFIAENVDGMAQNYKGQYVSQILNDFSELGYDVSFQILNAVDFGVPQYRRRIIFVGVKKGEYNEPFIWPAPTHKGKTRNGEFKSENVISGQHSLFRQAFLPSRPPVTIGNAIGDLLDTTNRVPDQTFIEPSHEQELIIKRIGPGQKLCNVRFANTSVYTWQIPEVFGEVSEREVKILDTIGKHRRKKKYGNIPNGNPLSINTVSELASENFQEQEFEVLVSKGYLKKKDGKYDLKGAMFCSGLFKRPNWDEPSPTVITMFHSPRYFVHPIENRPFTIREVARLQSFPDTFEFLASGISKIDAYRLIGNAVPPKLAEHIAKSVLDFLQKGQQYEASKFQSNPRREIQRI